MDYDSRIENLTPMEVRCLPMEDRHGRAVLVAIAKTTYQVSPIGNVSLAAVPSQIRLDASFHTGSPFSSIKYPSDYIDEKPGTDVIVVGTAIPPADRPLIEMEVSVRVGRLFKAVRVHGRRVYQQAVFGGLSPGPAELLTSTPILYELAQGGVDDADPRCVVFDRKNPSGVGFAETRHKRVGAPAHRLETPPPLAGLADRAQDPPGFGALGPHWSPRLELAGTRDDHWQRTRAPIHPIDFDPRHNCVAHPDLYSSTPLRPDEPVELLGMTAEGAWRFRLPDIEPRFVSLKKGQLYEHPTHLDTFLIDADERRVDLVWRAVISLPKKAQHLERVTVRATAEMPPIARSTETALTMGDSRPASRASPPIHPEAA